MISSTFIVAALLSSVSAHGVILGAQGIAGSPASVGFQVDDAIARNCTGISPCQQDTTIIRDAEIAANVVNECGRTELSGNIDVGENTENQLAAKTVTSVQAGTIMNVTIHQVNADGAGPYTCDLDTTSNTGVISQNLTVTNNVPGVNGLSQAKTTDFVINVAMPADLKCTGASTGNVCTVRCRNNALAGPFGGCFAVQQTDGTAAANSADSISTFTSLDAVNVQVAEDNADLPVAIAGNQAEGTTEALAQKAAADKQLAATVVTSASPQMTLEANLGGAAKAAVAATTTAAAAAAASKTTAAAKGSKKGKGNNNKNDNDKRASALRWAKRMVDSSE